MSLSLNYWNSIKRFEDLIAPYRVSTVQKNDQDADETTNDYTWMVSDDDVEKFKTKVKTGQLHIFLKTLIIFI